MKKKRIVRIVLMTFFFAALVSAGYYLYERKNVPPETVVYRSLEEVDRDIARLKPLHKAGKLSWQDTYRLGIAFLQKGDVKSAAEALEDAVKQYPDYYKSYESLGMAYFKMNRLNDAISVWEKAVGLNQRAVYLEEMIDRAKQRMDINRRAEALEKEVKKADAGWEKRFELAVLYLSLGRVDDSTNILEEMLKEKKDNPDIYHALAQVYIKSGKFYKAVEFMKKAVELKPDDKRLQKGLEDMKKTLERYEKIKKHIESGGGRQGGP